MPETTPPPAGTPDPQDYYTETVVEYVDNRKQRAALAILLVVLFILLIAAMYAVYRLAPGPGAPTGQGAAPKGIRWVRSIYGWGNSPDQALMTPTDVAIAPDGTIWVVSGHSTIAGFRPDGTPKKVIQPKDSISLEGIAVAENGNLFVTDYGGQLIEFTPAGEVVDRWKAELPNEVDVRDGKIALAAGPGVAVFTVEDSEMIFKIGGVRGWGKDQFDLPHGVVIAPEGTVYVSDTQNKRIKALSPTGRLLWTLGDAPDRSKPGVADVRSAESSATKGPFMLPSGMTMDGRGRIVLVDPFRFRIVVVDPKTRSIANEKGANGKRGRQAVYGDYGQSDGMFAYPTGIAYDKTRDWFAVADTYNNRVQIVRLPETGGNALAPIVGGFRTPMCVFCVPWILLIIAAAVLISRRRRQDKGAEGDALGADVPAESDANPVS